MTYEADIFRLREAGYTYNAIAKELGCSKSTVSYYCGVDQKNKNISRQHVRRGEKRQFIQDYKAGKPCMDCGVQYPHYVMDFDHRPDEIKLFNIGITYRHATVEDIKAEIAKCDLVCSNCHRERTWQRFKK